CAYRVAIVAILLIVSMLAAPVRVVHAADKVAETAPPAAQLAAPEWWFRAALEYADKIAPTPDAIAERKHEAVLTNLLWLDVQAGDVGGALAAAKKHGPQFLSYVASAQAALGDAKGALATTDQITDPQKKEEALDSVANYLISAGKLADAERVLKNLPGSD